MKSLVGGVFQAEPAIREELTKSLIPRSGASATALASSEERSGASNTAWGQGDLRRAVAEMKNQQKEITGLSSLPQVWSFRRKTRAFG